MVNIRRRIFLLDIAVVIGSGANLFVFPGQHHAVDKKLPQWLDATSKASAKKPTRQSEQAVLEATLSGTRQHYERLRALDQDEAVSARISKEETYFFLSNSAQLRTGTRVSAWIPQTSKSVRR